MTLFLLLFFSVLAYAKELQVPFVKQRDHFCGPASLSAVFGFYGIELPQEAIAERVYHPKLKGALITDLENYAKERGLKAQTRWGELSDLRELINKGIPPILLLETGRFGLSNPHYVVVVGYEGGTFFLHTGHERAKPVKEQELDRMWERIGRVMLVVYPP